MILDKNISVDSSKRKSKEVAKGSPKLNDLEV